MLTTLHLLPGHVQHLGISTVSQKCRGTLQGLSSGIVYLYRQDSAGKFVLSQRLTANASAVTGFGASMALAADGSLLLGAP